jgi:hypothetical protein
MERIAHIIYLEQGKKTVPRGSRNEMNSDAKSIEHNGTKKFAYLIQRVSRKAKETQKQMARPKETLKLKQTETQKEMATATARVKVTAKEMQMGIRFAKDLG